MSNKNNRPQGFQPNTPKPADSVTSIPDAAAQSSGDHAAEAAAAAAAAADAEQVHEMSAEGAGAPAYALGERHNVVSKGKPLLHLFTNEWFDSRPRRVVIDEFTKAQLDAGKLAISND